MGHHLFLERSIERGPSAQKSRDERGCDDPRLDPIHASLALLAKTPVMSWACTNASQELDAGMVISLRSLMRTA